MNCSSPGRQLGAYSSTQRKPSPHSPRLETLASAQAKYAAANRYPSIPSYIIARMICRPTSDPEPTSGLLAIETPIASLSKAVNEEIFKSPFDPQATPVTKPTLQAAPQRPKKEI